MKREKEEGRRWTKKGGACYNRDRTEDVYMLKRLMILALAASILLLCVPAAQAASGTTLRKGARGSEVTKLQTALKKLGYYKMKVDGIYGKGTVAAVKAYQAKSGLKADGIAGPKTLGKLYGGTSGSGTGTSTSGTSTSGTKGTSGTSGTSTSGTKGTSGAAGSTSVFAADTKLRQGDSGEAVKKLQEGLWYLGYMPTKGSGAFDSETRSAVLEFQKKKGLNRDGIAGKKTLAALETAWAAAKAAAGGIGDEGAALLNRIALESGAAQGTLVISKNGQTILTWSFGGADEKTCFRIASITKWVTAIGLMTLYDQGKLDLDRDISDYLPFTVRNPAWPGRAITARMLLSHTSSLSPDASVYRPDWSRIGKNGYDPIFDEKTEPGTKYAYADYNGALFGCLIEAISGESVQNYMDRTVFQPLGLTAAYTPNMLPAGTATKDTLNQNGKVSLSVASDRKAAYNNRPDPRANNGYTVGRLYINTASLTTLAQMMLFGGEVNGVRILKAETVALMEADQPGLARSKYGLSNVQHDQFPRGTWYGHQGRYSGLTSNVYYQKETGMTLALVMNGYRYQLEDNIVTPAATLMKNAEIMEHAAEDGQQAKQ